MVRRHQTVLPARRSRYRLKLSTKILCCFLSLAVASLGAFGCFALTNTIQPGTEAFDVSTSFGWSAISDAAVAFEALKMMPIGEIQLVRGDLIVLYTDGVTEVFAENGEEYGEAKLVEVIARHSRLAPAEILQQIVSSVMGFVGHQPELDDITLMALRVA